MLLSLRSALQLPIDVLPDLTKPTVTILTEVPGTSPEEVETLVSVPLEYSLMGVSGVSRVRTINDVGLSLIFVEFDWGTDIYRARQWVQERLTGIELPNNIRPYMTPVTSLMGNFMLVALSSPNKELKGVELRSLADWTVAPHLRSISGVSEVLAMGGGIRQVQIQPIPEKMLSYGIDLAQLEKAVSEAVSNTTGGFLELTSRELMVRNLAMTTNLEAIAATVVRKTGDRSICIGDVAQVVWDIEPMRGDAGAASKLNVAEDELTQLSHQDHRGVVMSITKAPGFDTLNLTDRVEKALAELRASLPDAVEITTCYRQADFIELSIDNLYDAMVEGAIMVALVLVLFLMNLRVTLITLTAIPLSMGMSVLVFEIMNLSVNSMTLGGLAVAIGMVVDDAIVDVENVFRRLRENAMLVQPVSRLEVIAKASTEVRSSIFYATILIVMVFLPLIALHGLEGRLFTPIAMATIISMLASFLVSLTVIPVLSYYLIKPNPKKKIKDVFLVKLLKRMFSATWLRLSLNEPILMVFLSAILLAWSWSMLQNMAGNFLPPFREPTVLVATTTSPGTSLEQTTQLAEVALKRLLELPDVLTVGYRVGRAEKGDHVVPVSTVEFDVDFVEKGKSTHEQRLKAIRKTMSGFPGTFSAVSTPLADRIGHMLSGVSAKIAIKVFGHDLEVIRQVGVDIAELARKVPGLEEAQVEQQAAIPQLRIEVNRQKAAAYGITPGDLNLQLSNLIGGVELGRIIDGQRVYDIVLRLSKDWRESPEKLSGLLISNQDGQQIPLSYVANLRNAMGPNTILRENSLRRFVVSINPTTSNLNELVENFQRLVKDEIKLPIGVTLSFEGEYEAQAAAKQTILYSSMMIVAVIFFLLHSYFKSSALVLLVFTMVPLSLIGGILLTGYSVNNFSIATLVGLIAVSGIGARNNIMLLSHYLHLMRQEGEGFTRAMVVRGTLERLVPILSTALSAGLALVPLILAIEEPGKEILGPIAVVIVGGLLSSTLLGLGLTPALFYRFCGKAAESSVAQLAPASE